MNTQSLRFGSFTSLFVTSLALAPAHALSASGNSSTPPRVSTASTPSSTFGFADTFIYCTALPNSTGGSAAIDSVGSLSMAANTFTLLVQGAPPSTTGMFFYGTAQAQIPMGDGLLCVSAYNPGIVALQPGAAPNAFGLVRKNLNFPSLSGAGIIEPGTTCYFQYMYRDKTAAGFNFSDGLGVTFAP
jgi:hypothetical protein